MPEKSKHKYEGDCTNIVYRSSWERLFMEWLCKNPDVITFSSEEFAIPYISPVDDRTHRYFVDFKVKFANFWKGILFFPYLLNGVAIGFMFLYFYKTFHSIGNLYIKQIRKLFFNVNN